MPRTGPQPKLTEPIPLYEEGGLFRLLQLLAAMLVVARLFYPPEGAVFGGTLWIVCVWILVGIIWAWDAYRRNDSRIQLNALDAAVWVIVFGHVVSTLSVLAGNGNARAALNLMWEWVGLGVSFFVLRQVLRTTVDVRRLLLIVASIAVMLAGYGLWQHYVELPRMTNHYEQLNQQLAQLAGVQTQASQQEMLRLHRELASLGVPNHPVARELWENRLKSTEPFATFALANTFAGFLVAWLFVLFDGVRFQTRVTQIRATFAFRDLVKLFLLLCVGYCLFLTKSRTAWVGFLAGVLLWSVLLKAEVLKPSRTWLYIGGSVLFLGAGFIAVAALSGGFDREVISEAPKSLAYRLQYWSGSMEVIKDHPLLGTGPGNFRQSYLRYKLPESSEEIADPHNWFLDLWTSGGLLALLGLLTLLVLCVQLALRSYKGRQQVDEVPSNAYLLSAWEIGAGLAFVVMFCLRWLAGEGWDYHLFGLLFLFAIAYALLWKTSVTALPLAGVIAGSAALLVHMLGAGGIERPAIVQTLLLFVIVLNISDQQPPDTFEGKPRQPVWFVGIVLSLVLGFVLCLMTAAVPVWYQLLYSQSGDIAYQVDHNERAALRFQELAVEADPYSPEPLIRLAELHHHIWIRTRKDADFSRAVQYGKLAIALDPVSNFHYRRLGQWFYERAEHLDSVEDANTSANYFGEAVKRYPYYAPLRAELALAYDRMQSATKAQTEARLALELDRINRKAGHREKYLSAELLETLTPLAR